MSIKPTTHEKRVGEVSYWVLIGSVGVVIILWLVNYFLLRNQCETTRGTFGDMFGAVNALFSGLAFAGLIYTILLQKSELTLQRLDMEETRIELEGQKLNSLHFNGIKFGHA